MKQCLIVDDSSVIRKVARSVIEGMKFEVIEAENGQEALERCQAKMPDVVLLDWHMPVMSGLEFLSSLHMHRDDNQTIVFYCMTENDPIEISRALSAGADEYILKPFDREALEAKFLQYGLH